MRKLTCIDLFAGCGGLSLGLEQAGFHPLLFAEINPSAAETYILNRTNLDFVPVGDIHHLTDTDLKLLQTYWRHKGVDEVDLVCGGPPCQGYSGIGHRRTFKLQKEEIPSNHLYEEMIRVIKCIKPRLFLFENVKGLLSSRWTSDGEKGEIFRDVLTAFGRLTDYHIRWDLVLAKDYGVPQNRPRVLMVGVRHDVLYPTRQTSIACEDSGFQFGRASAIRDGFLPKPGGAPPTLLELLSDLEDPQYREKGETSNYLHPASNDFQRMLRTHNGILAKKGDSLTEQEYTNHAAYIQEKYKHMIENSGEIPDEFKTKKFAQRVFPKDWPPDGPNLTATSLPEDYVHYSQPRIPTVREWARIQTFPDWYQFAGPRTTGGRRRAGDPDKGDWSRDVPKYTQIGNAVPVMLARCVGEHLRDRFLLR